MADKKLTELTEDTNPTIDDLLYVVSDPGGSPVDRKVTIEDVLSLHTPGTFVDRGDPAAVDFNVGDLTCDANYYDLDLSSIVPAGAVAVRLQCTLNPGTADIRTVLFRKNGNSNTLSSVGWNSRAIWQTSYVQFDVFCDANQVIEYYVLGSMNTLDITVTGWLTNVSQSVLGFSDKLIDRGDPAAWDFEVGDLTTDETWRDLDLSSIVPAGATFVMLRVQAWNSVADKKIMFRKNSNSNSHNAHEVRTHVAWIINEGNFLVSCDSSRVIEYWGSNITFSGINILVTGWVIDSADVSPLFVDRGDPSAYDFELGALTTDGTWRDLDLSSIVPDGAVAVNLSGYIVDDAAGKYLLFRKNGNSNGVNKVGITTQVANVGIDFSVTVSCDSSRVIEYFASNTTWTAIGITVNGWIL